MGCKSSVGCSAAELPLALQQHMLLHPSQWYQHENNVVLMLITTEM